MSICVLVKVPEGLVLAADSATTVQPAAVPGAPPAGVLKVFFNATKVLQLRRLPAGVITWGAGAFGARTLASLVEEFENTTELRQLTPSTMNVESVAQSFWRFLVGKSEEFYPGIPVEGRPKSGILLCGYSAAEFFPEEYVMLAPTEAPIRLRPSVGGQPDFGANWYGLADAIVRLHHGRDDRLPEILRQCGVQQSQIEQVMQRIGLELQYPVLFAAMPLGDAVEYAKFLVRTTIDRFRFVIGAELCGGPIDVATITRRDGFRWAQSKRDQHLRRCNNATTESTGDDARHDG